VSALRACGRQALGRRAIVAEYIIVGAIAVGILLYLGYALLFPEKF
jgi:K+-transporting ATPase KdpF subunit